MVKNRHKKHSPVSVALNHGTGTGAEARSQLVWSNRKEGERQFFPLAGTDQRTILWGVCSVFFVYIFIFSLQFFTWGTSEPLSVQKENECLNQNREAEAVSVSFSSLHSNSYRVDINTAGVPELCILPGIGETTARKIVAERETNGPFRSVEDIQRVHGIGKITREKLEPYLEPIADSAAVAEQKETLLVNPAS